MKEQVGDVTDNSADDVIEWPKAWGFRVFGDNGYSAFCGWILLLAAPLVAVFTRDPETKTAVIVGSLTAGGIALFLSSGLLGRSVRRGVALREDPRVGLGVVMRGQVLSKAADVTMMLAITGAVVLSGVEAHDEPDFPMYMYVPFVLFVGCGLWRAVAVRRTLVLTPTTVRSLVRGGYSVREGDFTISWDEIESLKAGEAYGRTPINAVELQLKPGSAVSKPKWYPKGRPLTRTLSGLVVPTEIALHGLQFYLAHPDRRGELGTDAAVHRFHEWGEKAPRQLFGMPKLSRKQLLVPGVILVVGLLLTAFIRDSHRVVDGPPGNCYARKWSSGGEIPAQVEPVSCDSPDAAFTFLGTMIGDHPYPDLACQVEFRDENQAGTVRGRSFPKDEFGTVCVEILE
ncbi:MAG: hypothetical protein GX610_23905 [Rhodococcus sp.]|nr:hypothetical protein [Rhodococcus sp. (in: high G+C Gram-positive bacteria)]